MTRPDRRAGKTPAPRTRGRQQAAAPSLPRRSEWARWVAMAVIAAAILLFVSAWSPPLPASLEMRLVASTPRSLAPVVGTLGSMVVAAAWRGILVVVVGAAMHWATVGFPMAAWGQAFGVAALCGLPVIVRWPSAVGVYALPCAVGLGLWAWWSARMTAKGPLRALLWFAGSGVACVAAVALLGRTLFEATPKVVDVPAITAEDGVRLEQMLKLAERREDRTADLHFTAANLTGIAAAWLTSSASATRLAFAGDADRLQCEFTRPVSAGQREPRYFNLVATVQPAIRHGRIDPGLSAVRVGGLRVPDALVPPLSSLVGSLLARTPEARRLADAVTEMSFAAGRLHLVVEPDRASAAFAASMALSPAASERLRDDVRGIVATMVAELSSLPAGDDRFLGLVRGAFEIAARPTAGANPAERNRAAIVALAMLIGDSRIGRLAGFPASEELASFPVLFSRRTTLQRRNDLARHFVVSAALRALSTSDYAMALGLFKEQLDAVDGGTGFSFTDIAADMAGLRFAENAVDPAGAARFQRRVAAECAVEAMLPALGGLPDGLSQATFETLYGSPQDSRYQMVIRVISHRMEACSLLTTAR